MKEFLTFLTAVVILAIAQTLTSLLGIVLLIFALLGVIAYPQRTFQLIASLSLLVLALKEPAYCIAALSAIGAVVLLFDRLQTRSKQPVPPGPPLLTHDSDH
ncbi:hypothetical protein [Sphingomonas radiodurans]|uniref:hypothetical protein n=1 Tax=Sphingomonas radiodurans TaxID=2890321 RepID=UPI001E2F3D4A|nr:hypothetical protein [Sphingomonas radiodurans]WBH15287.1 hypothetical protein LLW23_10555 [Sphingomonas radiodurans]